MAFKGTLKEFKVPDILQLISLQKKTGILTFTSSDGFITLIFEKGMIVGVDAFPKKIGMRVGNVLVKQDLVSEDMLNRALAIQKRTNQKLGEILIGMGLINKESVDEALKNQAVEIILSLFKWKKGEYNFKIMDYLDATLCSLAPISTDSLIMEGVQMLDEWPMIRKAVPDEKVVFKPVQIDASDIEIIDEYMDETPKGDKIYLSETEANILKYINGINSVKDLVDLGLFTEYKLYKSVYSLLNKKIIKKKETTVIEDFELTKKQEIIEEAKENSMVKLVMISNLLMILLVLFFFFSFYMSVNKGNDKGKEPVSVFEIDR